MVGAPLFVPIILAPPPAQQVQQEPVADQQVCQLDAIAKASDGVDLDEMRDLVGRFRRKRVSLGLSQSQVGMDFESLSASGSEDNAFPSYSQSQICRIERLDITPRQARAVKPILQVRVRLHYVTKPCDISHMTV